MSKKVAVQIDCSICNHGFSTELFRSIWIENSENRALVFDDLINTVTCPNCNNTEKLDYPFLCTNVRKNFALWYEPHFDEQVEKDVATYKSMMGEDSFYAKAPRISDWAEFKRKILEFESNAENTPGVAISGGLKRSLSSFFDYVTKEHGKTEEHGRTEEYGEGKYLRHLKPVKMRLLYSLLPPIVIFFWGVISGGLRGAADAILFVMTFFPAIFTITFVILSVILSLLLHWKTSKQVRLWTFGSLCWAVVMSLGFGVFGICDQCYSDEIAPRFILSVLAPLFIGATLYIYKKYIR